MGVRLDELMNNTPAEGGKPRVLRWLVDLFELWGGSEAADIDRRREEIARMVNRLSGVSRGLLHEGAGIALQSADPMAWHIRLAIMTLLGHPSGDRAIFLSGAGRLNLPKPSQGKPRRHI